MINPLSEPYAGGTEAVTARLARALAERGHSVTVLATEGSHVPGVQVVTLGVQAGELQWPSAPDSMNGAMMRDLLVAEQRVFHRASLFLRRNATRFDLVHNHSFSGVPLLMRETIQLPMLTTLHVPPILLEQLAALRVLHEAGAPAVLSAVSAALAREYHSLAPVAYVIHNGVDVPSASEDQPGEDLLFVGRIAPEKGADQAIAVARAAGRRLILVGRIEDRAYYEQAVAPSIDAENVAFLGHRSHAEVWELMGRAHALLFTPRWPEPCSLAVLEGMGRGAPAIAFALGGLPEQIVDGTTGFLVPPGNIKAAAIAVARVPQLSRSACKAHVRRHFSLLAMVTAYERCYTALIEDSVVL